jgi:hypothetical protein
MPSYPEFRGERLATPAGYRPVASARCPYQTMGMGIHEHEASVEPVEPEPPRQNVA